MAKRAMDAARAKALTDEILGSPSPSEPSSRKRCCLAAAIQKAGAADRQKIIEALHKQGIPGVLIPEYRFDENGDVVNGPLYIYTIDKGAFKLVEQFKE